MVNKFPVTLLLLFAAACGSLQAQSVWSLRQCIDYALAHNIRLQQQQIDVQNTEIQLETSRYQRLPDLNASLGQGFGFGRSTARDGSTVDRTSANTSFSISASMPVFTGFRIPNQVRAGEFNLKAASASLEKARQDISVQVATAYLQTLYYDGTARIAQQQVELNREELRIAAAQVEAGRKPESEKAQAEAKLALSEHSLTQAEGNARLALLDLRQLLNLTDTVFSIAEPDTSSLVADIPMPSAVFAQAEAVHPSVTAARYSLEGSRRNLKVARSYNWPSLSLSASYSNSYYHIFDQENASFGKQLDLNGSEYVGLNLSIPIFNRFQTRNSIRQSRLSVAAGQQSLLLARQNLRKEIEQAYCNAVNARFNLTSAQKAASAATISYRYAFDSYSAGRGTQLELQNAQTQMLKARQDALQARYEFLIRMKILEYYNGVPF